MNRQEFHTILTSSGTPCGSGPGPYRRLAKLESAGTPHNTYIGRTFNPASTSGRRGHATEPRQCTVEQALSYVHRPSLYRPADRWTWVGPPGLRCPGGWTATRSWCAGCSQLLVALSRRIDSPTANDAFDRGRGEGTAPAMGAHPFHDPCRHLINNAGNRTSGRGVGILSVISSVFPSPFSSVQVFLKSIQASRRTSRLRSRDSCS